MNIAEVWAEDVGDGASGYVLVHEGECEQAASDRLDGYFGSVRAVKMVLWPPVADRTCAECNGALTGKEERS